MTRWLHLVRMTTGAMLLGAGLGCTGSSQQQPEQSSAPECPVGKRLANGTCPRTSASQSPGRSGDSGAPPPPEGANAVLNGPSTDTSTAPGTDTASATDATGAPVTGGAGKIGGPSGAAGGSTLGGAATATATDGTAAGLGSAGATSPPNGTTPLYPVSGAGTVPANGYATGATGATGGAFPAGGASPSASTDPVAFVGAPASAADGVPAVKLVASIADRKLLVYAALSHVERVADFAFQYPRDKYPLSGQPTALGDFVASGVTIPVLITFTFDGHRCRVQSSADFTERQLQPTCD